MLSLAGFDLDNTWVIFVFIKNFIDSIKILGGGEFPCCNFDYVNKVVIQYFSYLLFIFMDSTILFKNNGIVIRTFPTTKKWLNGLPECFVRHYVVSTGCYFEKVIFHAGFSELYALFLCLAKASQFSFVFVLLKRFLSLDLVMMGLASSFVMKGAWLPLMTSDYIGACLLTTSVYFVTKES